MRLLALLLPALFAAAPLRAQADVTIDFTATDLSGRKSLQSLALDVRGEFGGDGVVGKVTLQGRWGRSQGEQVAARAGARLVMEQGRGLSPSVEISVKHGAVRRLSYRAQAGGGVRVEYRWAEANEVQLRMSVLAERSRTFAATPQWQDGRWSTRLESGHQLTESLHLDASLHVERALAVVPSTRWKARANARMAVTKALALSLVHEVEHDPSVPEAQNQRMLRAGLSLSL